MAFDNAQSKMRLGFEAVQNRPAADAAMVFEPEFSSTDLDPEQATVVNPNIRPSGHQATPLPGKNAIAGSINSALDADGLLPVFLTALRKYSTVTDLGGGAYRFTAGRSQATAAPSSFTVEKDRDDGIRDLGVGMATTQVQVTLANDAPTLVVAQLSGTYATEWATGAERHPNPATGSVYLRGVPPQWLDRANGTGGDVYLKLVDLYTDSSSRQWAVFLARVGAPGAITGTWSVTASTAAFTGSGGAALTEIYPGDVIDVEGQMLEVLSVTDNNTFTTTTNHTAGAAAKRVVREYGAAAEARIIFSPLRPGLSSSTGYPRWHPMRHSKGVQDGDVYMGDRDQSGQSVEAHLTASTGIVAGTLAALTGTVSVTAASATVTGSGTAFLSELEIGAFISTAGGQEARVLSIASDTSLTADANYATSESAVAMNARPIPKVSLTGTITTAGTTALTGSGTLFTTELAVGSWVRTAGGEVNRILSITDNTNAVMVAAWTGSEAGVAGTTDYEWQIPRERADWSAALHASGPFPEVLSEAHAFFSTSDLPEERVELANAATWTFVAGKAGLSGIGSVHGATVKDSGQSTGTIELTMSKVSAEARKAVRSGVRCRVRIVQSTGVLIGTSVYEYTWEHILNFRAGGKPVVIPDATTNADRLGGTLHDNPADPDGYVDAWQTVVTSDRSNPAPVA